jgi:hypothetical protein
MMVVTLPASKIADVNRGIFLPLSNLADGGLTFTLELDVTSGEGIPRASWSRRSRRPCGRLAREWWWRRRDR